MAAMMLLSGSLFAQQSPKLLKAYNGSYEVSFEYDNAGRIVKDVTTYTDGDDEVETRVNTYTYAPDKIVQRYAEGNLSETDSRTAIIENGKIVKETIVMSAEVDEHAQDVHTYTFTYNAANQLVKIVDSSGHAQREETHVVTWTDGCPSNVKTYREGEVVGEMDFTYDTSVTNSYLVSILHPLQHFLSYEAIMPFGQLFGGYYGVPVKYAMNGVKYNVYVENYYGWDERDNFTITYNKDTKGQVVSGTQTDEETTTMRFEWEQGTTGIAAPALDSPAADSYYDVNGVQQPRIGKGLNIIRSANGAVRKVVRGR